MNKFLIFLLSGLFLVTGSFFVSVVQAQAPNCQNLSNICRSIRNMAICSRTSGCVPSNVRTKECLRVNSCIVDQARCPNLFKDLSKCCRAGDTFDLWDIFGGVYTATCSFHYLGGDVCRPRVDCPGTPSPTAQKACCSGERLVLDALRGDICLASDAQNSNQGLFWPLVFSSQCPRNGLPSQCVPKLPESTEAGETCGNGIIEGREQCDKTSEGCGYGQICGSACHCVDQWSPFWNRGLSAPPSVNLNNQSPSVGPFWPSFFNRRLAPSAVNLDNQASPG